jgi:hypothetical protein
MKVTLISDVVGVLHQQPRAGKAQYMIALHLMSKPGQEKESRQHDKTNRHDSCLLSLQPSVPYETS